MTIIDVSMYQPGLQLDTLPDTVTGVIIKATQGLYEDPGFRFFVEQARADPRWKYIGFYHFLSDKHPDQEAAHFLATINSIGGLRPREFEALDYENNSVTGYAPPQADAVQWMTVVDAATPGRVCWYTDRHHAIPARQSGLFPWPLWLADPNPDGRQWALTLNAFLLQYGQQVFPPNIDVNDIIDISVLDAITGDDNMATPEEIAAAVWDYSLSKGSATDPARQWLLYIHDELTRSDKLQDRLAQDIAKRIPIGAAGLAYSDVVAAVKESFKAQAALISVSNF